jgi:hypothetical protein
MMVTVRKASLGTDWADSSRVLVGPPNKTWKSAQNLLAIVSIEDGLFLIPYQLTLTRFPVEKRDFWIETVYCETILQSVFVSL